MNTIISTINHGFFATYKPTGRYLGGPILYSLVAVYGGFLKSGIPCVHVFQY